MSNINVSINGHQVPLIPATESNVQINTANTKWYIFKFDRFVDYNFKQELRRGLDLDVFERLGDNIYLCEYRGSDLIPIGRHESILHYAAYPANAVQAAHLQTTPAGGSAQAHSGDSVSPSGLSTKMPFVLELQPSQNPQEVLDRVKDEYGAEQLDDTVAGSTIQVKLKPEDLPKVSEDDSIRSIDNVREAGLFSIRQRAILQFVDNDPINTCPYKGEGETVFVADSGFDRGSTEDVHPAFERRVLATVSHNPASAEDGHGHGTHVAGSILGCRQAIPGKSMSDIQGTAPNAKLVSIAIPFGRRINLDRLLTEKIEKVGAPIVMNHSWGSPWDRKVGPWNQYGYEADNSGTIDEVLFDHPEKCFVWAAGNDGELVSAENTQQQIGAHAAAKNCITVGATYSDRPVDESDLRYSYRGKSHSPSEMTTFSSTGPTRNGRMAPDVVAPGAVILSARSRAILPPQLEAHFRNYGEPQDQDLLFMDGTSQATPAVTGCVAVLRGAFRTLHSDKKPTGALLKALIIHGAVDLKGTKFTVVSTTWEDYKAERPGRREQCIMTAAPNPFQGYGRVDINSSLWPILGPINGQRGFAECDMTCGKAQNVYTMNIPRSAKNLTVTLVYTDKPGEELQIKVTLRVKLGKRFLTPLEATDPKNRNIKWAESNVAKVFEEFPPAGQAEILLDIETSERSAKVAVVWSVEVLEC